MIKTFIGLIVFLIGVLYAIKTAIIISKNGLDAVPFLDISSIIKGVIIPLPFVIAIFISAIGIIISYSGKKKK